jgi:membrane-bound O-acyltransferase GUP1_2
MLPKNLATELSTKQRPRTSHDLESYNVINYVAYVLYPPLYMAGPIITFNDFLWQVTGSTSRDTYLYYLLTSG